ncbi:MAG TPA: DUF3472 domain-containing protein, partial [Arachidicoccus sp.]
KTQNLGKGVDSLHATYITLLYDLKGIDNGEWFYNEINVPKGEAPAPSYYSAIGGVGFYSGIQVNSKSERRVVFSVWDDKEEKDADTADEIPDTTQVTLLKAGDGVTYSRFGKTGSGLHTHWVYNWKNNKTYKFLMHCQPDTAVNSTVYTMYFFTDGKWKMIAQVSRQNTLHYFEKVYSFLEDWSRSDDAHRRAGYYQNQWVRKATGEWVEITDATFGLPFGDGGRSVKDYGCGLAPRDGYLLISGGGYDGYYVPDDTNVSRTVTNEIPVTELPE